VKPEVIPWIAIIISMLSLAVSTLSLYLSWRAFHRDRSDLRVTLKYHPKTGKGTSFRVLLVNHGRRPVHVERVLLRLESGKELLYELTKPIVLQETQSHEFWFPLNDHRADIRSPSEIKRAEAYDTRGNRYTFPSFRLKSQIAFRKLKRQIAKDWTPENDWLKNSR
jgi:hypothetical protein